MLALKVDLSPYALPEGHVHIAFSGGRTSAFMLHQILEANGDLPDRCVVSFQNTGREMPQTYDFVAEVGLRWGVEITWLEYRPDKPFFEVVGYQGASRNGEPFDALIAKKKAVPNQAQKWCSAELKSLTAKRYLVAKGWKIWSNFIGFRADEPHRNAFQDNRAQAILPLRVAGVSKHHVTAFWQRQPFDLDLPVVNGQSIGGNCDGCFLKSEATIAALSRDHPTRASWWEKHEDNVGHTFSKRYSRRELREFMERQGDWALSTEGALCQKSEGECAG